MGEGERHGEERGAKRKTRQECLEEIQHHERRMELSNLHFVIDRLFPMVPSADPSDDFEDGESRSLAQRFPVRQGLFALTEPDRRDNVIVVNRDGQRVIGSFLALLGSRDKPLVGAGFPEGAEELGFNVKLVTVDPELFLSWQTEETK